MSSGLAAGLSRFADSAGESLEPSPGGVSRLHADAQAGPVSPPPDTLVIVHAGRWRVDEEGRPGVDLQPGDVLAPSPALRRLLPSGEGRGSLFVAQPPRTSLDGQAAPSHWIDTSGGDYVLRSVSLADTDPDAVLRFVQPPMQDADPDAGLHPAPPEAFGLGRFTLAAGDRRPTSGAPQVLMVQEGGFEVAGQGEVLTLGPGDVFRTPQGRPLDLYNPWSTAARVFALTLG